ncbi:MAG: hypothetical protein ABGW48_04910, partial [Nitrosopumilus sp.]
MDKKKLGIIPVFAVIALVFVFIVSDNSVDDTDTTIPQVSPKLNNESIGMVINSPSSSVTLQQLDEIFADASSSGIGRSNVYLYWNMIEPVEGKFDWLQSD